MSDWKDTVMSEMQRGNIFFHGIGTLEAVCEAQAEISFKAGQEEQPRTPRTDLENELADKEFAKLYRKARIKTQREIDLCLEAHKAGIEEGKKAVSPLGVLNALWAGRKAGIREGLISNLTEFLTDVDLIDGKDAPPYEHRAEELLKFLHSQGVVILVDRELPVNPFETRFKEALDGEKYLKWQGFTRADRLYREAGFFAVEPLIEEVNDESLLCQGS